MPTHVICGDSFLVRQALRRLMVDAGIAKILDANRHQLQGNQVKPTELFSICSALPFMDTHRLVVVTGLLDAYEPKKGRGRGRRGDGGQSALPLGGWKELKRAVPEMPETTLLVFTGGPIEAGNPMLRLLRPLAQVQTLSAPAGEGLARWIKESAKQKHASISPTAIKLLTDLVGNDLWTLDLELEKLSLYASGRTIEESDIRELVSQVREANIFSAVDAMIDGTPGRALRLLRQLWQDGRDFPYLIAMMERQLRLLALARDLMDKGVPQAEVGKRLGALSQFVLRKTLEQARRHSLQDITGRYHRLLEADLAVKRGIMAPDLALELLVVDHAPVT